MLSFLNTCSLFLTTWYFEWCIQKQIITPPFVNYLYYLMMASIYSFCIRYLFQKPRRSWSYNNTNPKIFIILHLTTALLLLVLHSTSLHCTAPHNTPLHFSPLHSTPLNCTPLISTPLHFASPYFTSLVS